MQDEILFSREKAGAGARTVLRREAKFNFALRCLICKTQLQKIAFEMSKKDEMFLKYRHVNLRSLQLGPSFNHAEKFTEQTLSLPPDESM